MSCLVSYFFISKHTLCKKKEKKKNSGNSVKSEKNNNGEVLHINYECTREGLEPNVPFVEFKSALFPYEQP